jgi:homoaconitase/3-isopropylmalate dehydratase large subunit
MNPKTLLEKVWEQHEVVPETVDTPAVLYIDLHLVHEVTSPQAFSLLRSQGLNVRRTDRTLAAARATLEAAMPDAAADLVASLDTERLDEVQRASVDLLRGKISLVGGEDGAVRGPEFILRAAQTHTPH